jgi:general secretion pathway protein G
MRAQRGFTLVEILIVVVILGILAAIVIPQFTEASTEAKLSSLCSDLQTVRSQIELYKVQHNDNMPGTAGAVTFVEALTLKTVISGALAVPADTEIYGPYLQAMPKNPFNDLNTVEVEAVATGLGGGNCGWHFNTATGDFRADDAAHVTY